MTEPTYEVIRYAVEDPVALITLNRPEALNAWTARMGAEVRHALARAEADPQVVGIILTGAGRAFCAGADMGSLQAITAGERGAFAEGAETLAAEPGDPAFDAAFRRTYSYVASIRKPVIAAVNGPCAGLALALVVFCDLRFASENALFVSAFPRRGLIAEHGTSWMLPRLVGPANALDILLSGRRVKAEEALAMGLVSRVVPAPALLDAARGYIEELAEACSPASMAIIKRQVYNHLNRDFDSAYEESDRLMRESFERPDMKEGVDAFVERRPPRFARLGGGP